MLASLEISLYPLTESYEEIIIDFLKDTNVNYPNLRIETNGLSTQIFGSYDTLMELMQNEIKTVLDENKAVFVFKLAKGERTPESVKNLLDK